uniref:Agc yank protein kinase n=1 Tax=Moniliophthora roreri TaxID=221103 RepID=A0A0W0FZC0_MONRR
MSQGLATLQDPFRRFTPHLFYLPSLGRQFLEGTTTLAGRIMGAVCCRPTPIDFDGEVTLFHFVLLRCVGKGAFGKVRVVQHKQTRELYALKYINKAKCVKMKAVPNVIQERRLLEEVDHPFIVNLRYAFQDDENCFFVLDLMLGGDLRFHLERLGSLSEEVVRFYVAQLSSALEFLHENGIMHSITKDPLKWPEDAEKKCSRSGMLVLKGLLERDTSKRLGCAPNGEGFQELKNHPWFKSIDWDTLETKEQTPPFVPDSKKANFDASHELEELLLEDNPLKAKQRKANQDNLTAEMRQMEEQFTTYDFKKMQRRSYYPHNQQLVSTATATSSGLASSRPATPGQDLRTDGGITINSASMDLPPSEVDAIKPEMTEKDYR